ncbi:unnamed protein product [Rotaria sp. Silwood1]|nr:unnamed protein product [Rotaria sp. Silwood1]
MTERTRMHQISLQNNDMPIHKFIPMEKLDFIQSNQVRILYYQSPSRFYVYLRQKINTHAQFQVELQCAMQNYQSTTLSTQYIRYQPVAAQDHHAIWHRATILGFNSNETEVCIYFVDVGEQENISITNIRPLPQEFIRQPAFAIPCRLYQIYPLDGNEQLIWRSDDPVHDEFNRLMANNASCKVCDVKEQICYDVEIEIPKVGDLGTYLFGKNLVSRITMRPSQPTTYNSNQTQQQTTDRIPPGFSAISSSTRQPQPQLPRLTPQNEFYNNSNSTVPQPLIRALQKPIVQQPLSSAPISADSLSSEIQSLTPQDGYYIITHVYSAIEFYGHSQGREKELDAFYKHLEDVYNNNTNDQSLSVHFLMEGIPCVIQQGDKYHRVTIKHRESESRVLVKLIDRGDEIIVDTSELLKLEKKYFSIPAFAQPFRLYNYDESHSTANITRKLKRLILNQRVHITQHLPTINGFYPVEVKLSDNQLVNQILLSNDNNPIISPPMRSTELQPIKIQQDMNTQRINDDLPAPQKLLTAAAPVSGRTQPGRFTTKSPVVNEPTSRFSRSEQQDESRPFGQQTQTFTSRTANGFQQLTNEQNRSASRGFSTDEPQTNQRNGFGNNRGGGFADRGNRNGFSDRNFENKNENSMQRTGGFTNRTGGFAERGSRNEGFHDRHNENRNNQDEDNNENSNTQRFGNRGGFSGERGNRGGGFQSFHDKESSGDSGRRGGRGGQRGGRGGFNDRGDRGGFSDRGGRGGFNDRGGRGGFEERGGRRGFGERGGRGGGRGGRTGDFEDRNDNEYRSNSDNNDTMKTFSGWPNVKSTVKSFEAGDHFLDNEIPQETFQFVISHIETSNDFFIQLYSKADELSTLSDTLQNEYKNAPEVTFNSLEINQACLAKSSDQCWYRAIILSINLTTINVRFIDFGDTIDVDKKSIRQLEKKLSLTPPYAYRCMLENVEVNENIDRNKIIEKCADRIFNGKIQKKLSNNKYLLQSDNFQKSMIDINAIKLISKTNIKCHIVYINIDKYEFYIQDDNETMTKINNEITTTTTTNEISLDDIQINTMVISLYNNKLCRAIIQADLNENVRLYFVDYGDTNICSKTSLKQCNEQLKTYPYQAKRCQLYDISSNMLDEAFKKLHEYIQSDKIEISIVNQDDTNLFHVLLYIDGECFNEKFHKSSIIIDQYETSSDINDQSSTTTATTVKDQERPMSATGKRNSAEISSPGGNSLNASMNNKRQKSESETDVNLVKYYRGILTHLDENKPLVYVQLLPESESMIEQINDLIDSIIQENKQNSSYEIGDYVIAQFTDDMNCYRARIESYSDLTQNYTVYFLDYGNLDKNVPKTHLYSYTNELKQIKPQAHGYLLENLTSQIWINKVRSLIENKLNEEIEFYFIDEIKSIIHMKFDDENQIYTNENNQPKTFTANISGINNDCFYIHILPDADTLICEMDELLQTYEKEHNILKLWSINDLCIVYNNELNQYFRGKILSINNDKYNIQCIDYGNIINDITNDNIYLLPNNDILKQLPLARQCRLYGVNNKNQIKAIEDIIKNIHPTECVTITVENDQNDQCMDVMLFRENHEIVNDRYQVDDDTTQDTDADRQNDILTNTSDSAIAADDDTSNIDVITVKNDQHLISPIGIPQAESTHQFGDSSNVTLNNSSSSITINQTIDFGENDPSTSNTTLKDDTENENILN